MKIPQYESDVNLNDIPTNRVPTEAPLAAFGGGEEISQAFTKTQALLKEAQVRADKSALRSAELERTELELDILHGSKDENGNRVGGVLGREGEQAFGAPEDVDKAYSEGVSKIMQKMNPRQQRYFQEIADNGKMSLRKTVQRHVSGEIEKFELQKFQGVMAGKKELVKTSFQNPEAVKQGIEAQKVIAVDFLKSKGVPAEKIQEEVLKVTSDNWQDVIMSHLETGGLESAKSLYEANKGEINADTQEKISKAMKIGDSRVEGMKAADYAWDKKMGTSAAEKYFREKFGDNVDARIFARSQFNQIKDTVEGSQAEYRRNLAVQAGNILRQNGGDLNDPRMIPIINQMTPSEINGLSSYSSTVKYGDATLDVVEYENLKRRIMAGEDVGDEEIMMTKNLKGKRDDLLSLNNERKSNSKKFQQMTGDYTSSNQIINQMMPKSFRNNPEKAATFRTDVESHLQYIESLQDGKRLSPEEQRKEIEKFTVGVITDKGFLWDSKKKLSDMTDQDVQNIEYDDIPADELKEITEAYSNSGVIPTQQQILNTYLNSLRGQINK
jgi:hypothetical protein